MYGIRCMPYAEQALPLQPTKKFVVVELARLPSSLGDLVPWWLNGYVNIDFFLLSWDCLWIHIKDKSVDIEPTGLSKGIFCQIGIVNSKSVGSGKGLHLYMGL